MILPKNGLVLDRETKRVGFRTAELIQDPFDAKDGDHDLLDRHNHGQGTSFFFKVNGVPMFMGGSLCIARTTSAMSLIQCFIVA